MDADQKQRRSQSRNLKAIAYSLAFAVITAACVTVHVNFPESTVQKATDDYVRELYESKDEADTTGKKKDSARLAVEPVWEWDYNYFSVELIRNAQAGAPTFDFNFAEAKEIQVGQKKRIGKIDGYKKKGDVGEGNDGLLVIKTKKKGKIRIIQPIVDKENAARKKLFSITKEKYSMGDEKVVRESFARSIQMSSPKNTWIQDPGGNWVRRR